MKAQDIVEKIRNSKGQHVKVIWAKVCKTKGGHSIVVKKTVAWVRSGIDFSHLKPVKEAIENGERGPANPLPWGKWKEFPFVIEHQDNEYVRLYPSVFDNLRSRSEYTRNGEPVALEDIKDTLYASELSGGEKVECFTVKADNVISVES